MNTGGSSWSAWNFHIHVIVYFMLPLLPSHAQTSSVVPALRQTRVVRVRLLLPQVTPCHSEEYLAIVHLNNNRAMTAGVDGADELFSCCRKNSLFPPPLSSHRSIPRSLPSSLFPPTFPFTASFNQILSTIYVELHSHYSSSPGLRPVSSHRPILGILHPCRSRNQHLFKSRYHEIRRLLR